MTKKSKARFFRVGGKYTHPAGIPFRVVAIRPEKNELGVQFLGEDGVSTTVIDLVKHKKNSKTTKSKKSNYGIYTR